MGQLPKFNTENEDLVDCNTNFCTTTTETSQNLQIDSWKFLLSIKLEQLEFKMEKMIGT